MKNYKQNLNFYYKACNEVADMFAKQYFCDKHTTLMDLDEWWVAGDIGGVLCINDYFWNMEDMVEALKVGVSKKTLFEYYDWSIEDKRENNSLHYFLNLKKIGKVRVNDILNVDMSKFKQVSNPLDPYDKP